MSVDGEDDTELRDLVVASLQSSGVLGKIKAQLRSNVYLALEGSSELQSKSRLTNPRLDEFMKTSEGRLVAHLVREYLEFFDLDYSKCVFEPEAMEGRCGGGSYKTRDELTDSLGLVETLRSDKPILSEIIRLSKVSILRSETPTLSDEVSQKSEDETSAQTNTANESSHKSFSNPEATFVVEKDPKPEPKGGSILSSLADLPKLSVQSSLSDLPPLTTSSRTSPVKLASHKKVPTIEKAKAAAVADEPTLSPLTSAAAPAPAAPLSSAAASKPGGVLEEQPLSSKAPFAPELKSNLSLEDDEIEEEMDDFLNSSVSASEDFTKDETASEAASLKADFVESLK